MTETTPPPTRLAAIDAYRGLVMVLLLAEALELARVARALPGSAVWRFLAFHQSHVEWLGCSLHDLIQPSFTFLVGVSLPFSLAARRAAGQSAGRMLGHAVVRTFTLVALGIFLRSMGKPQTNYTFEDTLTQIGLGYAFLFLLALAGWRTQLVALGTLLVGTWLAFALYTAPPDYPSREAYGVPPDWPHLLPGFEGHWNKNGNAAWAFDAWFLNLFPRQAPFIFNGGGYATLSFVPTLGTMLLGLFAGRVLRLDVSHGRKLARLALLGAAGLASGYALGALGVCPVVKRIWTPSWVLFSGGWCFLLLAAFYAVHDALGWRRLALPLLVVGANSIAAYLMEWLAIGFTRDALKRHLGPEPFRAFGPEYEPVLAGAATLAVLWLVLAAMYRRKWFLKI